MPALQVSENAVYHQRWEEVIFDRRENGGGGWRAGAGSSAFPRIGHRRAASAGGHHSMRGTSHGVTKTSGDRRLGAPPLGDDRHHRTRPPSPVSPTARRATETGESVHGCTHLRGCSMAFPPGLDMVQPWFSGSRSGGIW